MPLRCSRLVFAFSAAVLVPILGANVRAEDPQTQTLPDVANSKYQFTGTINSPSVQIRSGPGDNYYPTMKLDKGSSITVVGYKFDWLKIAPPEGSFSVVAKAFIAAQPDGKSGLVTADPALNVRAGSDLSKLKVTVQCKLPKGSAVQIVGEVDEYYKIKPPAEAFVYVHQKYVDPGNPGHAAIAQAAPAKNANKLESSAASAVAEASDGQNSSLLPEKPATRPAE